MGFVNADMEKSASGMDAGTSGPAIASAPPPPSAPPSYEEAVGSIGMINPHRNVAPYPTSQPGIPTPCKITWNNYINY